MTPQEAQALFTANPNAVCVDVRTRDEYASGHVLGSCNVPLDELPTRWHELAGHTDIACICRSGGRSAMACQLLAQAPGLGSIHNIEGGMLAWAAAGLPIDK